MNFVGDGPFGIATKIVSAVAAPLCCALVVFVFSLLAHGIGLIIRWRQITKQGPLRVPSHELIVTQDEISTYGSHPFTGVEERIHDGILILENHYQDSLHHGWCRTRHEWETYEFGQLKSLSKYEYSYLIRSVIWDRFGEAVEREIRHRAGKSRRGSAGPSPASPCGSISRSIGDYEPDSQDRGLLEEWEGELDGYSDDGGHRFRSKPDSEPAQAGR